MGRVWLATIIACLVSRPIAARGADPPRITDAPVLTIRPVAALAGFTGERVAVTIGWRPVRGALRYRVTFADERGTPTHVHTTKLRIEHRDLAPGRYQVVVTPIDERGAEGPASELLPLTVIEVRAIPPGATTSVPPTRGAFPVGTRFSVPQMHCTANEASLDDLLVGPENELRMPIAGLATVRCAGIPGYLEKAVVIAPVTVTASPRRVVRGRTERVRLTLATVAQLGEQFDVRAIGDATAGSAERTEFGLEVPVAIASGARSVSLAVRSGDFELGRVPLVVVDAPKPPRPPPPPPIAWWALDLGAHVGLFVPPSTGGGATAIGRPTDAGDVLTGGPLVGGRLGVFPTRRVGIEAELSLIAGGYADQAEVAYVLAPRVQLAVRAIETTRVGLRVIAGTGAWSVPTTRGTSRAGAFGEVHAGLALAVRANADLWVRFQIADAVTTARDDGYAHALELQLAVVTRVGRRDSW